MNRMLLAAAASLAALGAGLAPAQAQMASGFASRSDSGSTFHRSRDGRFVSGMNGCGAADSSFHSGRDGRRSDGRRGGGFSCGDVLFSYYGGEWAANNNRSWDSDSYNDWWHDRPDRAYPAWMRHNQDCQRPWFAGNTLTC